MQNYRHIALFYGTLIALDVQLEKVFEVYLYGYSYYSDIG